MGATEETSTTNESSPTGGDIPERYKITKDSLPKPEFLDTLGKVQSIALACGNHFRKFRACMRKHADNDNVDHYCHEFRFLTLVCTGFVVCKNEHRFVREVEEEIYSSRKKEGIDFNQITLTSVEKNQLELASNSVIKCVHKFNQESAKIFERQRKRAYKV